MSLDGAIAPRARSAHGYLYTALCLTLAGAGFATARVTEALVLLLGVVAYLALASTRVR